MPLQFTLDLTSAVSLDTHLPVPRIVQDDGGVGVVAQENGHEGGDELVAQGVPGGADLQQRQHKHVGTVLDGEAEKLLDLLVLAHLREP